jgi:perosamine synthetase
MSVDQVRQKLTPRTRAIMPVHIYGNPVDMQPLEELAQEYGLHIVEDAAEAHGGEYRGRKIGSFGTSSCFSFYANKLITTGEGGMLLTDDAALAERARRFRNLGFQPGRRFVHAELGFNFRLTNLQAALGVTQVERIDAIVARKRAMATAYAERLSPLKGLELQLEQAGGRSVYWMYGLLVRESTGLDAAELARRLTQRGIETRPFFLGMHEQPVLRERGLFVGETYPVTERLARQGLYLPSSIGLDESQIDCICAAVREALE